MSKRIELNGNCLVTVFTTFFDEAIRPKLNEMSGSKRPTIKDSIIHAFSSDWGDICVKMEYRHIYSENSPKGSKRYFWVFTCPSESENVYECPQISPETLVKKMLIQHPKQPLINIFGFILKEYLSRDYLCVIDEKGFYWELSDEYGMTVLKEAFKSACLCAFGKTKLPAPIITVSERKQENEIVDDETFYNQFFTGLRDDRFISSVDRFRQIRRLWKIYYEESEISISTAASLFERPSDRETIRNRILSEACRFPLFNSLLESGKYGELHNLLRELCSFSIHSIGNTVSVVTEVLPPVQSIAEKILSPVRQSLSTKEYTSFDYIIVLGKYAKIAGDVQNIHCFWDDEISSDDSPFIQDAIANRLIEVFNDKGRKRYKFRLKQFRLFTAAMASALNDNARWRESPNYPRVQEGISRLLNIKGTEREEKRNKDECHYAHYYSAESFYGVCYLEYTDSNNKRDLIDGLMDVASDFRINDGNRTRQEKAISILSYLLLENGHEFSGPYRQAIFDRTFAKTLYKPQGEMWVQLKTQSAFYARHAKEQFLKACELDMSQNASKNTKRNLVAVGQPYFNFLQADIYTEEEYASSAEPLQLLLRCCAIQRDTWYLSNNRPTLSPTFVEDAFNLIDQCVAKIKFDPNGKDIMFAVYGLSMVFYGLANLKYQNIELHAKKVEERISSPEFNGRSLFEAVLLCDYWNRRKNAIYDSGALHEEYYLLAGAIRFICSYNLDVALQEAYSLNQSPEENIHKCYEKWLAFQKKHDLRYYHLMLRLLSYTDFDIYKYLNRSDYYRTDFLLYDNFPRDYSDFYNNPHKLYYRTK